MANYKSIYTGPQIDEGITKANEALKLRGPLQLGQLVKAYDQGTVEATDIKTINGESILGSGDIKIQSGGLTETIPTIKELPETPTELDPTFVIYNGIIYVKTEE